MSVFAMRFYWKIGQENKPDPGLISLRATDLASSVVEADELWFNRVETLSPPPIGYLIYESATQRIVHERSVEGTKPVAAGARKPKTDPAGKAASFWRLRLW